MATKSRALSALKEIDSVKASGLLPSDLSHEFSGGVKHDAIVTVDLSPSGVPYSTAPVEVSAREESLIERSDCIEQLPSREQVGARSEAIIFEMLFLSTNIDPLVNLSSSQLVGFTKLEDGSTRKKGRFG